MNIKDVSEMFYIKKERGGYVLIGCKNDVEDVLIIPEGITKISQCAFLHWCSKVKKIVFPSTLKKIPNTNFELNKKLSEVVIPEGVIQIAEHAFQGTGLKEITLPSSIEKIGKYAFGGCEELKKITINHISTSILNSLINEDYSIYGPFSIGYKENKLKFSLFYRSPNEMELTDFYKYYDKNDKTKFLVREDGSILYDDFVIGCI